MRFSKDQKGKPGNDWRGNNNNFMIKFYALIGCKGLLRAENKKAPADKGAKVGFCEIEAQRAT